MTAPRYLTDLLCSNFWLFIWILLRSPALFVLARCRPLNSHGFAICHTVSLPFSRSHIRFFISQGFKNFEQGFSQTHSFLKKQTQGAHSNVNKEHISSMINKNETSTRSSLSLSLALLFINVSEDTY